MLIGIDASRAVRAQTTGTEAYSRHLIQALVKIGHRHQYRLYTPTIPSPNLWSLPQTSQPEIRVIPFPRLWTQLRLAWELTQKPPDVLFVPAHVMPWYCPIPTVVTTHDLGYLHYPETHRPIDRWYLNWTTRRHTRQAEVTVADSEATRRDLCDYYQADPDRIAVIYPGRDETLRRIEDPAAITAARTRYGIKGDYLLYLGTLQPRKNLLRLVDAFAQLRQKRLTPGPTPGEQSGMSLPDANKLQLVLAGKKGWLHEDLMTRIDHLSLQDQVILPGYVADQDKAALISGASALVFPSLHEGFGLPVLESMACGTPVLTSNTSSLPEVAGDGALLVDPHSTEEIASGMAKLISNPSLRETLIRKGYSQVREFSWDRAARQLLEVLDSVEAKLQIPSACRSGLTHGT